MAKEAKPRRLRGCLIGCGAVLLAGVVLTATLIGMTFVGYGDAIEDRAELDRLYPTQATFTPASDGRIDADRMRRFLAVRAALVPHCEQVTESQAAFARMADHSGEAPEPDASLVFDALKTMRRVPRIGSDFGGYVSTRNQTLLENEMGLGEYTWIYVTGYFALLGERPVAIMSKPADTGIYATRVFDEVAAMIRRHIEEEELDSISPWRTELDALTEDPGRVPFEDGLPAELGESLEPYRAELEAVSCPEANELDAVLTERRGMKFEHF